MSIIADVWLIKCVTENKEIECLKRPTEAAPTMCPNDCTHTVGLIRILDHLYSNTVEIQSERVETNKSFTAVTIDDLIALPTVEKVSINYRDFPGSIIKCIFRSDELHRGDMLSVCSYPDKPCGVLTAPYTPPPTYDASATYTTNNLVIYDDGLHGARIFKCLVASATGILPTIPTTWVRQLCVFNVSSTVVDNVIPGYDIKITNGVTAQDLDMIASIDKTAGTMTMTVAPTIAYAAGSVVMCTAYFVRKYIIGPPDKYTFGHASMMHPYAPAGVPMVVKYKNNSTSGEAKKLHFSVHYWH